MSSHNLNDIDLNNLAGESPPPSAAKVSSKNDVSIINDMMSLDQQFISIMDKRIKGLEVISEKYKNGDFEEAMADVGLSKDLGVVNDFFRYALIKKDLNKISLKSDMRYSNISNYIKNDRMQI